MGVEELVAAQAVRPVVTGRGFVYQLEGIHNAAMGAQQGSTWRYNLNPEELLLANRDMALAHAEKTAPAPVLMALIVAANGDAEFKNGATQEGLQQAVRAIFQTHSLAPATDVYRTIMDKKANRARYHTVHRWPDKTETKLSLSGFQGGNGWLFDLAIRRSPLNDEHTKALFGYDQRTVREAISSVVGKEARVNASSTTHSGRGAFYFGSSINHNDTLISFEHADRQAYILPMKRVR